MAALALWWGWSPGSGSRLDRSMSQHPRKRKAHIPRETPRCLGCLWPCRVLGDQIEHWRAELCSLERLKQLGPQRGKGPELGEVRDALGAGHP